MVATIFILSQGDAQIVFFRHANDLVSQRHNIEVKFLPKRNIVYSRFSINKPLEKARLVGYKE